MCSKIDSVPNWFDLQRLQLFPLIVCLTKLVWDCVLGAVPGILNAAHPSCLTALLGLGTPYSIIIITSASVLELTGRLSDQFNFNVIHIDTPGF